MSLVTPSNKPGLVQIEDSLQMIWPGQQELLFSDADTTALLTGAGFGKCVSERTPVLMADGYVKEVQEIKVGEQVAGSSGPRRVLRLLRGNGRMFKITLINGDSHTVNHDHILTLICSGTKEFSRYKDGDIIDVTLKEYLTWGPAKKKRFKMFKAPVDFIGPKDPTLVDPYVLGCLLGDGSVQKGVAITTMDFKILQAFSKESYRYGLRITSSNLGRSAPTYRASGTPGRKNLWANDLETLGILGTTCHDKAVPFNYKTGSRETRLQVLAGLMDTDGSVISTCYDYITKSKQLAEDVVFIARSLGFTAHLVPSRKKCQTGAVGDYWRVTLSDCTEIPSRIKKLEPRNQIKKANRFGFTITPAEDANYYGFELDGDHRFLLADFTVTHNSRILTERIILDHAKQDFWWEGRAEFNSNPILFVVGAAHEAYLAENTVPMLRATIDQIERKIGRTLRKKTGRDRDGWYGAVGHRRQEMANCVDIIIKAFPTKENAVAVTCAGLYFDEVTMLSDIEIWRRSQQRVREPRAKLKPNGKPHHYVVCVGTPEEDHFIHEVLVDPLTKLPLPGTKVIMGSSISNPVLPIRWFENQAHSSNTFKEMQVMGKWVRGAGGQRFAHIFREDHHIVHLGKPASMSGIQYDIGWDPGYRTGNVVIMWQRPRDGVWFVVDEIVIENMTTYDVCAELLRRGYNHRNIRHLGMDPRDAGKMKSNSRVTDAQIAFDMLKVRPKIHHVGDKTGEVYVRFDVLEDMLVNDKLFINDSLKPRAMGQLGLVNALKNFATRKVDADPEKFVDKPTRDSLERWKHPLDAIHYVLLHYERGIYQKVIRQPNRNQILGVRG